MSKPWSRIIEEFFTKPTNRQVLFSALRRDVSIILFIYAKLSSENEAELSRLKNMAHLLYSDSGLPATIKFYYRIFRLVPASPAFIRLMKPALPIPVPARSKALA